MNTQYKVKFLNHLAKKKNNKGFTLIELLVVVIIVGVLAAIALPNLLGQVAKGRQAEAKNSLGAINRAQQAHRLEKAQFADKLETLRVTADSRKFYDAPAFTATDLKVGSTAKMIPISDYTNDIRAYGSAVGQTEKGVFSAVICEQQSNPGDNDAVSPTAGTGGAAAKCATGEEVN